MATTDIGFSVYLCFVSLIYLVSFTESNTNGFTLDLIHRDSQQSPFYNPSNTRFNNLNNAFHRSISRSARFKRTPNSSSGTIQAPITASPGEYLMKVSLGTPPVEIVAIADTGSDLTWTQCIPCTDCFKQNIPLFDPQSSATYRNVPCQSKPCKALQSPNSCTSKTLCKYSVVYGDQSFSNGDLAVETFTFGSTPITNVVFGCGQNDVGNFNENITGIVGLGGAPLSIVRQLSRTINGLFSYCLVPLSKGLDVSSKINFGSNAVVSGSGVVSTPLVTKDPTTFYYLTLDSVSIENTNLEFVTSSKSSVLDSQEGNIIIDSGTTLTLLPSEFYTRLESALKSAIPVTPSADPSGFFNLCYSSDSEGADMSFPVITFHFRGADLNLPPTSTFIQVDASTICLAMIPSTGLAIYGNLSQMDFLIGYDLVNKMVSFKPTDCTNQ